MINGGKYKIYRSEVWGTGEPTSWILAATINAYNGSTPVTSWTDTESLVYIGPRWLHYKITALDNTQKESVASEKVKINGRIPKIAEEMENNINDNLTYFMNQNYPNPFNPSTTISYQIKETGNVKIIIYDALGREVTTLVNEIKQPGNFSVTFDADNLTSGIYFVRMQANEFNATRKIILAK